MCSILFCLHYLFSTYICWFWYIGCLWDKSRQGMSEMMLDPVSSIPCKVTRSNNPRYTSMQISRCFAHGDKVLLISNVALHEDNLSEFAVVWHCSTLHADSENEFNMKINCCNTFFRCCRDDVGEHQTSLSSLVMCYFPGLWPDYVLFWIHMCI